MKQDDYFGVIFDYFCNKLHFRGSWGQSQKLILSKLNLPKSVNCTLDWFCSIQIIHFLHDTQIFHQKAVCLKSRFNQFNAKKWIFFSTVFFVRFINFFANFLIRTLEPSFLYFHNLSRLVGWETLIYKSKSRKKNIRLS